MSKLGALAIVILLCFVNKAQAQTCKLSLSGQVLDKGTQIPLSYASIRLSESGQGVIADDEGNFRIKDICPGEYHIIISHVGFEMDRFFVEIVADRMINFQLDHHDELLNEVVVHGVKSANSTQNSNTIGADQIIESGNENLADILESLTGVHVLKTGTGISKPIIHGLYGNRLKMINNGLIQTGQQWGSDHAPEIDPFIANHLSVVKGVSALEYSGGSVGGIILIDPSEISSDPHLHGETNYIFQSNGLGHTTNTMIEKAGRWTSWRATGTLKIIGDRHTPDYFLTNTGKREANIALQTEKEFGSKWQLSSYYSLFNTEIGIIKGSHVSNLTDLHEALEREVPFDTKMNFTYQIEPPRQVVQHHLGKIQLEGQITDHSYLRMTYGGQYNHRKEFDVRRGGRSSRPTLSLNLGSHYLESVYGHYLNNSWEFRTGLQNQFVNNANDTEYTDVFPLIPNYRSNTTGLFLIASKKTEIVHYEAGGRYDYKAMETHRITRGINSRVITHRDNFHSFSASTGATIRFNQLTKIGLNVGFSQRAPEVNELYSDGLHQGVSGIERGNSELKIETSLKSTISLDVQFSEKLFMQSLMYLQEFDGYIFLEPTGLELSNRGAFPAFEYKQTNARLYGLDWLLAYEPYRNFKSNLSYTYLRGVDTDLSQPLIFMPPNNLSSSLTYSITGLRELPHTTVEVNARYVFEQKQYQEGQDIMAPPGDYFLIGSKVSTSFDFSKSSLKLSLRVQNLLNTQYRDYLNRLRYFADEVGRNFILSANYSF